MSDETRGAGQGQGGVEGHRSLRDDEIQDLLAEVPGWRVERPGGKPRLVRELEGGRYAHALEMVRRVGELGEREGHPPEIHLGADGRVRLETWTRDLDGLHRDDFVLAVKVNRLLAPG